MLQGEYTWNQNMWSVGVMRLTCVKLPNLQPGVWSFVNLVARI